MTETESSSIVRHIKPTAAQPAAAPQRQSRQTRAAVYRGKGHLSLDSTFAMTGRRESAASKLRRRGAGGGRRGRGEEGTDRLNHLR